MTLQACLGQSCLEQAMVSICIVALLVIGGIPLECSIEPAERCKLIARNPVLGRSLGDEAREVVVIP